MFKSQEEIDKLAVETVSNVYKLKAIIKDTFMKMLEEKSVDWRIVLSEDFITEQDIQEYFCFLGIQNIHVDFKKEKIGYDKNNDERFKKQVVICFGFLNCSILIYFIQNLQGNYITIKIFKDISKECFFGYSMAELGKIKTFKNFIYNKEEKEVTLGIKTTYKFKFNFLYSEIDISSQIIKRSKTYNCLIYLKEDFNF